MDQANWWIIDVLGPAILLVVLVWLVMRRRSTGKTGRTEQATRELYTERAAAARRDRQALTERASGGGRALV